MATIIDYARGAQDAFVDRTPSRVDLLCLAWLAYLRLPAELGCDNRAGLRLVDLAEDWLLPRVTVGLHNAAQSAELLQALAASPRFANVRACLHVSEADEAAGMQFSATTYVLPDGAGAVAAFRGTDDTTLGWKENLRLACDVAVPAQRRAARYVDEVASELGCRLWVCGHSKGGALAAYACGTCGEETRGLVAAGWSFDGPGVAPELRADPAWRHDVPVAKVVPHESLVGMLFEPSQEGVTVVRSTASGVLQHDPLTWEVADGDFVCERGMSYDAWRLARRLNDWLEGMKAAERRGFVELVAWLVDVTAETSFSGLLRRWSSNARAMRAALVAAPAEDRELFVRVMDDLVATVLFGSRRELGLEDADDPQGRTEAASRRLDDLSVRVDDRLSRLDRLTGR